MQALACEVVRAFTKLGIAIAANKPMMATTIMISTSVKPAFFDALIFILLFYFRGVNNCIRRVNIITLFVHALPDASADEFKSKRDAKSPAKQKGPKLSPRAS